MNIIQIYKRFPSQQHCIDHLELIRWNNEPACPYCGSKRSTLMPKENRHHCNSCNTSYSVMVDTIFENTKLDFQKWFLAITLMLNAKKGISSRQLARDIEVTKDTAWRMQMQIRKAMIEHSALFEGIVEADETYIGGKNRNKHSDKKTKGGQGRNTTHKTPVFGILQRDGKVIAKKVSDVTGRTLKSIINTYVAKGSTIMTDEWGAYNGLCFKFNHNIVNHGSNEFVNGDCHTNSLEGFWSLLKRGIIGQYHKVSKRHLEKYVNEFCYRYNNRKTEDIFNITLQKALGK